MGIKIRVLGCIPPHAVGAVVDVETDDAGTPLDFQWRRRLKDAKEDNCCEVVADKPAPRAPKTKEKEE